MSRIIETLKNKNLIEKAQKQRRREELQKIQNSSSYKAALSNGLKQIGVLLDNKEIEGVIIEVPEKMLPQFSEAIYSEELAEYDVMQIPGKANLFSIKYKLI